MSITFRTNRLPVHNLSTSEQPIAGPDAEPTVLVARLSNQSHADAFLCFRYVYVSGMFIMITVILSLTDSIEYG